MSFRYIVKFAQIKTHLQIQCNIGKIMLIKIIVAVIDILISKMNIQPRNRKPHSH